MAVILERQYDPVTGVYYTDSDRSWWWTREGQIARYSIFSGLLFLFLAFIFGGYWHAKRRINKGLKPLGYHRWLLSRNQRARYDPRYQNPSVYYVPHQQDGSPQQYGMYTMPPPIYDPNTAPPPVYQPPAGGTKVDPVQSRDSAGTGGPAPVYEAPPGPPPAVLANNTGASNNPYRL